MAKLEAGHLAKSTIGAVVGTLEEAGGGKGLVSSKDATLESYEYCLAVAS